MKKPAILYDADCILCNAEINHYKKNDPNKIFNYINIMSDEFKAENYQLKKQDVHRYFHVIDKNGEILIGVEAFYYIWQQLDKFSLLQRLYSYKLGRKLMNLGYQGFILARPFLPRKKQCDSSNCQL